MNESEGVMKEGKELTKSNGGVENDPDGGYDVGMGVNREEPRIDADVREREGESKLTNCESVC